MNDNLSETLGGPGDSRECARKLILLARQRVYIISQHLEAKLYNDKIIYNHLNSLATRNRKTDIRIIAQDTRSASNQGHFLINLAQKLPTFAQIRTTVTRADKQFMESWLIVDDMAYMRINNLTRYEGNFETNNKLECQSYITRFEDIWETCQVDQNTRRLSL